MQSAAEPSSSSAPAAPATSSTPAAPGTPRFLLDRISDPASSPEERYSALRTIKNEVAGTLPKKEAWVRHGALDAIVAVLRPGQPQGLGVGDGGSRINAETLTAEELVRSEALRTLASLVKGGPPFLAPIHAAGALPAIFAHLSPTANPPQVVLAALCVADNLGTAADLSSPTCVITPDVLAGELFTSPCRDHLQDILSSWLARDPGGRLEQVRLQQVNLVTKLMATLCRREEHQLELADDVMLDHLASLTVSIAVAQGNAWDGVVQDPKSEHIPQPAPRTLKVAPLMDAISAIIADSNYRVRKFLWSPAFVATFLNQQACAHPVGAHWSALEKHKMVPQDTQRSPLDCLMPAIRHARMYSPVPFKSSLWSMSGFNVSLSALDSGVHWDGKVASQKLGGDEDSDHIDSQAVPWLIHQMRLQRSHVDKLAVAHVIACVSKSRATKMAREISMCSLLVVPPVMGILQSYDVATLMGDSSPDSVHAQDRDAAWYVLKRAPAVISRLAVDQDPMDKAVSESRALHLMVKIFGKSHTASYRADKPVWWSPDGNPAERLELPGSRTLGEDGMAQINLDIAQVREATLRAIAVLCFAKDDTRQLVSKEGGILHMVESLNQGRQQAASDKTSQRPEDAAQPSWVKYGRETNPVPVLMAACNAVRVLARSPLVLRTTMMDCDVFTPIFKLLSHPDVDAQVAALAAMANLVVRMSQARDKLIEMGVADVLCKLARSSNPTLRFNALWGIKHLVDDASLQVKKSILEQLTPEWLLQGIIGEYDGGDDDDIAAPSSRVRDRLDIGSLLSKDQDDDVDMGQDTPKDPEPTIHERLAARLEDHWRAEANPATKAYRFDVLIQEQCINVVRNMVVVSGSHPHSSVIIDMLFASIEAKKWFEALLAKLQMRPVRPASRSSHRHMKSPSLRRSPPPPRVTYPRIVTIQTVIYTLVNLAASESRYRDLVLQQTRLIELISHQAVNCKNTDVSRAVCHLINNLIDETDHDNTSSREYRVEELKRLGIYGRLETLRESTDKDVQQLVKGAISNMDMCAKAQKEGGSSGGGGGGGGGSGGSGGGGGGVGLL